MENSGQKSTMANTNPFLEHSSPSNEHDDYAEPFYRTSTDEKEQNVSEYAEPYQSQNI